MSQTTDTILMIRPVKFRLNEETSVNNYYQKELKDLSAEDIQEKALNEFDDFAKKLRNKGIRVIVVNDTEMPETPDSIFPNNWVSFHKDGQVALYPMFSPSRRNERRLDLIEQIAGEVGFQVTDTIDFTKYEDDNLFLEGTGSLVLDRENKIAYAALSDRTHSQVLEEFCKNMGYKAVSFTANQSVGDERLPIYHTNVMMAVGSTFAIICLDAIDNDQERAELVKSLEDTNKEIITISEEQTNNFAGNMLEVSSDKNNNYLVMSSAAYNSLSQEQIKSIEAHSEILHSSLSTIETLGGGSARCMMAEVFYKK